MTPHATRILSELANVDAQLASKGFPRLSAWWAKTLRRFYMSGRRRLVLRVGRRGGKSSTMMRLAVVEALYGDHVVPPGDIGVIAIVSVEREEARARLVLIAAILDALGVRYKPAAFGEGFDLVDRPIGFRVFTASIAGVSGYTAIGLVFDEVAKWRSGDSSVNPAPEVLRSARPMIATMPNAREFMISSPFSTLDAHHEAFAAGDDEHQITAHATTWEANPTISEAETHALEPDELTWRREYGAEPIDAEGSAFFSPAAIDQAIDKDRPLALAPNSAAAVGAGADFAFKSDSSALAIVHRVDAIFHLADLYELRPTIFAALKPSKVVAEFTRMIKPHGITMVAADSHYSEAIREHLEEGSLSLTPAPEGARGKTDVYQFARVVLHEGRLKLPKHPKLRAQLRDVIAKPTPSGTITISSPRRAGSGHGDLVSALVLAIWEARTACAGRGGSWEQLDNKELGASGSRYASLGRGW